MVVEQIDEAHGWVCQMLFPQNVGCMLLDTHMPANDVQQNAGFQSLLAALGITRT